MVKISPQDLAELIYWARRYCDGRATYAPSSFNAMYQRIRSNNPEVLRCHDKHDKTLMDEGSYWPYAQDGMYNKENGSFNAVPRKINESIE